MHNETAVMRVFAEVMWTQMATYSRAATYFIIDAWNPSIRDSRQETRWTLLRSLISPAPPVVYSFILKMAWWERISDFPSMLPSFREVDL